MEQHIGFLSNGQKDKVCHLKRSIYGLKQSFRSCYFRFHEVITLFGLSMILEDYYMYVRRTTKGTIFLILYAGDILLVENNLEMIEATKKWLPSVFEMKDIGEAKYVLSIKIFINCSGFVPRCVIKKVLKCFQILSSKHMDAPIKKDLTLNNDECPKKNDKNRK